MFRNLIYPVAACLILLTSMSFLVVPVKYSVKEGFKISFKSKDPSGVFEDLSGTFQFDEGDLASSKIDFNVKVSSINTGNAMKDKKAQTSEWFDAAKYPNITFKSTKIESSSGKYYVYGKLTMKGASKDYKIPMTVTKKDGALTLTGAFVVKRLDFKVGKPSQTVPDAMNISYSIPMKKN